MKIIINSFCTFMVALSIAHLAVASVAPETSSKPIYQLNYKSTSNKPPYKPIDQVANPALQATQQILANLPAQLGIYDYGVLTTQAYQISADIFTGVSANEKYTPENEITLLTDLVNTLKPKFAVQNFKIFSEKTTELNYQSLFECTISATAFNEVAEVMSKLTNQIQFISDKLSKVQGMHLYSIRIQAENAGLVMFAIFDTQNNQLLTLLSGVKEI